MIFIRSNINANVTHRKLNSEAIVSEVLINVNDLSFNIMTVYKSPSINSQTFIDELSHLLEYKSNIDIDILTGDLNIDINNQEDFISNDYLTIMGKKDLNRI